MSQLQIKPAVIVTKDDARNFFKAHKICSDRDVLRDIAFDVARSKEKLHSMSVIEVNNTVSRIDSSRSTHGGRRWADYSLTAHENGTHYHITVPKRIGPDGIQKTSYGVGHVANTVVGAAALFGAVTLASQIPSTIQGIAAVSSIVVTAVGFWGITCKKLVSLWKDKTDKSLQSIADVVESVITDAFVNKAQ